MRTSLLVGLLVTLCVVVGVGTAAATDSHLDYPDTSFSQAFYLGNGNIAFVFWDFAGDRDIFVHPVGPFADLIFVALNSTFTGFGLWLDYEGKNGSFFQYGVYACKGSSSSCSFSGRLGTLFL